MASRSPPAILAIRTSSEVVCIAGLSAREWVAGGGGLVQAKSKKFDIRPPGTEGRWRQFPLFRHGSASQSRPGASFTVFLPKNGCRPLANPFHAKCPSRKFLSPL